ncbi:MAG: copper amine oxidase N-terminal domain-containing protein [Defluviitaleaceae bacterium]|nr:copper amine oxidase N-terminal domain-containing protein [Defluviitaleaceae bacterium]
MKKTKMFFAVVLTLALLVAPVMNVLIVSGEVASGGNAFFGGTMMHEYMFPEWRTHEEQSVPFTVGEPFTAVLDAGGDTFAHVHAGWGYAFVVQTDIRVTNMAHVELYDVFIDSIVVDGSNINFNADAAYVAYDGGIRIGLTSYWAEGPTVLSGPTYGSLDSGDIGSFSRIEVTLAITEAGADNPFDAPAATPAPTPTPAATPAPPAGDGVNVTIDGVAQTFEVAPEIIDGRTMLPLRAIGEALGMEVDFDAATSTATLTTADGTVITHVIHTSEIAIDGTSQSFDASSTIVGGRTLVPVRMLAEAIGADVGWDAATRTAEITTN